jgi:serine/threonine-protein kinase
MPPSTDVEKTVVLRSPRPQLVGHCERFLAEHVPLAREVELRVVPEDAGERRAKLFERELEEMAGCDHPGLLPVLERGETRGRPYYLVPVRDGEILSEVASREAPNHRRCQWVRQLASALAELHLHRVALGPVHFDLVLWEERPARLTLIHHRHRRASPYPEALLEHLPEDVRPGELPTSRSDLFHWAWAGVWLLTGQAPFRADGGRPPVRELAPWLGRDLAHALDASLAFDPRQRMAHAAELQAFLLEAPEDLAPGGGGVDLEASGTIPYERIAESVESLRQVGKVPSPATSPRRAPELDQKPPGWDRPGVRLGLLAAGLTAFGLGIAGAMAPEPPPASAPEAPRPTRRASQGPLGDDPYVRLLVNHEAVAPRDVRRLTAIALSVHRRGLLPDALDDRARLEGIAARHVEDPEGAARDLELFLQDLRELTSSEGG